MVEELAKSKIGRCPAVNAHLRPGAVKVLAAITYDGENFNIFQQHLKKKSVQADLKDNFFKATEFCRNKAHRPAELVGVRPFFCEERLERRDETR